MDDRLQLFLFGEQLDCDSLITEAGGEWRAIFELLADELNLLFFGMPRGPIRPEFRLEIRGEDVDLDAVAGEVGRDWRPILDALAPKLDSIFRSKLDSAVEWGFVAEGRRRGSTTGRQCS